MPGKKEDSTTWRGDVMRRMAAIHVEMYHLQRAGMSAEKYFMRTKELKEQLAALMEKFLA